MHCICLVLWHVFLWLFFCQLYNQLRCPFLLVALFIQKAFPCCFALHSDKVFSCKFPINCADLHCCEVVPAQWSFVLSCFLFYWNRFHRSSLILQILCNSMLIDHQTFLQTLPLQAWNSCQHCQNTAKYKMILSYWCKTALWVFDKTHVNSCLQHINQSTFSVLFQGRLIFCVADQSPDIRFALCKLEILAKLSECYKIPLFLVQVGNFWLLTLLLDFKYWAHEFRLLLGRCCVNDDQTLKLKSHKLERLTSSVWMLQNPTCTDGAWAGKINVQYEICERNVWFYHAGSILIGAAKPAGCNWWPVMEAHSLHAQKYMMFL